MEPCAKDNMSGENHTSLYPNRPVRCLTATSFIGDKIFNNLNEELGEVNNFMLNINKGTIEYVVIEFGGFLGMGEKLLAVPFRTLLLDVNRHAFILGVKREVLKNAPGFDKEHWPETNSHVLRSVSDYWVRVEEFEEVPAR